MPRGQQSKGSCGYCETEISKGSVTKHLSACSQRRIAIEKTEQGKAKKETLVPHDNYREPIPVVNSPRMGRCGYTGPAEPIY